MTTRTLSTALVLALFATLAPASADDLPIAGLTIPVPDGWKASPSQEEGVSHSIGPAEGGADVLVLIAAAADLDGAVAEIKKRIEADSTSARFGDVGPLEINGLDARFFEGQVVSDGFDLEIAVVAYSSPSARVVVLVLVGRADGMEQHREALGQIIQGVKG